MKNATEIRERVRERYGALAEGSAGGCGCGCGTAGTGAERGDPPRADTTGCCGSGTSLAALHQIGYSTEQAAAVPKEADLGLGCGNPLAFAGVRAGETVLDLGSGAGIDAFLASREVGPDGRVIGVDMTHAMLDRARATASREGYGNVEFRLGEIEHLPVADASVDVIISNCVINLSPEKRQVFAEAFRVLRPGGRLLVSDLVLLRPLPESVRQSVEAYVGCVAGASLKEDYLRIIREAGFTDAAIVRESRYGADVAAPGAGDGDRAEAMRSVVSVAVRARKPTRDVTPPRAPRRPPGIR
ncbi:MAG TPA: arsenite methyltransferase [Candidatus Eisenbacteria bacterium]